jgi:hypothetical protein
MSGKITLGIVLLHSLAKEGIDILYKAILVVVSSVLAYEQLP